MCMYIYILYFYASACNLFLNLLKNTPAISKKKKKISYTSDLEDGARLSWISPYNRSQGTPMIVLLQ